MKGRSKILGIRQRYVKIPIDIFRLGLSPGSCSLYVLLLSYPDTFNPSLKKLAIDLGISRNSIRKLMNELIDHKVLKCNRKGNNKTRSEYEITGMEQWVKDL